MSLAAISWAWQQPVPRNQLLELLAIADHANDLGVCWVRVKTIAAKARATERSTQRNVAALVEGGYLEIIERRDGKTGNRCNLYVLNLPGVDQASQQDYIEEISNGYQCRTRKRGVTPVTPGGRHQRHLGDDASDTHNPQSEPTTPNGVVTPSPAKGKTRIRENWQPDADTYAALQKAGIPQAFAQAQLEEFTLYWQERNDAGAKKASWRLTFINWVKRNHQKEKAAHERAAKQQRRSANADLGGNYHGKRTRKASGADLISALADRNQADDQGDEDGAILDAQYDVIDAGPSHGGYIP